MPIAYTMAPGRGDVDALLFGLAEALAAQGLRPRGIVQTNTDCPGAGPCDMDVKVLPDGPVIRISQSLGTASRGCRLDPAALEQAVGLVEASLDGQADLLLVNKFGKHEADGRGFRDVIARAMIEDLPVLVGLNALNAQAFEDFTGGLAVALPPAPEALLDWVLKAVPVEGSAA